MRNYISKIAFTVFITVLLPTMSYAANNLSALEGYWVYLSGSKDSKKLGKSIELSKDGTGMYDGKISVLWKIENKRFILQEIIKKKDLKDSINSKNISGTKDKDSLLFKFASDYKVFGSKLIFTYDKGDSAIFIKKVSSSFTDSRDGKSYKTIKLDNQTWMTENLNYEAESSKCYENNFTYCEKYGRLYNWVTAKKACPDGWHLPSDEEWQTLVDFLADNETAGNILKASNGWTKNGNGVNTIGFSALPGGDGSSSGGFLGAGKYSSWWSSTENGALFAYYRFMYYNHARVDRGYLDKGYLYSVRCVQDYEIVSQKNKGNLIF